MRLDSRSENTFGNVLYGVPEHLSPTVALHNKAIVVEKNIVTDLWKAIAIKSF